MSPIIGSERAVKRPVRKASTSICSEIEEHITTLMTPE
jgi:hypothetical protein